MNPISRNSIALASAGVLSGLLLSASNAQAANRDLNSIIQQQQQQIEQLQERLNKLETQTQQATQQAQQADTAAQQATQQAEQVSKATAAAPTVDWSRGVSPTITSPDGKNSIHINGRVYGDYDFIRADDNPAGNHFNTSASQLRSARIGIDGKFAQDFQYRFNVEFAGGTEVKDAYIDYNAPFTTPFFFRVGQYKTPNSLEQVADDFNNTFMEQAAFIGGTQNNGFGLDRSIGAGTAAESDKDNYTVAFGAFSQNARNTTAAKSGGYQLAARATKAFKFNNTDDELVHVGGSVRWRDLNNQTDNDAVIYRARPFFNNTNRSINTGTLNNVNGDLFLGPELALVYGPFSFQSEAGWNYVDGAKGRDDATGLWGGYMDVSYYLTGESRRYSRGAFRSTKVLQPVTNGGWGAWQLATRVDYLDLNNTSADIRGGQQWSAIVGLNWLPVDFVKLSLDYAHTHVFNGNGITTQGDDNSIDGVAARAAINF